jgi:hypothetical protein
MGMKGRSSANFLEFCMAPEPPDPNARTPPAGTGVAVAPVALPQQPGFGVGLCSIALGVLGFGVPVLGMLASCAGIGLGIWGFRRGRAAHYPRSVACGIAGISVSILSFVFWPYVLLSSSYR